MALQQKTPDKFDDPMVSLLKVDGKGWNLGLFAEAVKLSTCLCARCHSICCDAVELACEHDDDDILLYCNQCLTELIQNNENKCIINSHTNPLIAPSRSVRRQIYISLTICPFSTQKAIKSKQQIAVGDGSVVDTLGNDEKEGHNQHLMIDQSPGSAAGCQWEGPFKDLLQKHMKECAVLFAPDIKFKSKIRRLETENKKLTHENQDLKQQISRLISMKDEEMQTLRLQLTSQFKMMQETMSMSETESKTNDQSIQDDVYRFYVHPGCKTQLTALDNKTLFYKGKLMSRYYFASFGPVLDSKDKVTMYFDAGTTGSSDNFFVAFGSVWEGFVFNIERNVFTSAGVVIYGNGKLKIDGASSRSEVPEVFRSINDKKSITKTLKAMKLFVKDASQNIIAVKVDMTKKKGWVWNTNDNNLKVEINLFDQTVIGIGVGGTEDKIISVQTKFPLL